MMAVVRTYAHPIFPEMLSLATAVGRRATRRERSPSTNCGVKVSGNDEKCGEPGTTTSLGRPAG